MADCIVTLKIMPDGVEADLNIVKEKATEKITAFGGEVGKAEEEPVAFGLKALKLIFVMDESKGSTEPLKNKLKKLKVFSQLKLLM